MKRNIVEFDANEMKFGENIVSNVWNNPLQTKSWRKTILLSSKSGKKIKSRCCKRSGSVHLLNLKYLNRKINTIYILTLLVTQTVEFFLIIILQENEWRDFSLIISEFVSSSKVSNSSDFISSVLLNQGYCNQCEFFINI